MTRDWHRRQRVQIGLSGIGLWIALGSCCLGQNPRGPTGPQATRQASRHGALLIAGGGELPQEVRETMVRLAGGTKGRLVVIPTASQEADEDDAENQFLAPWRNAGLASVCLLHAAERELAEQEDWCEPLRQATAVWLSGGDQSRLADRYLGTPVERELYRLLERGGVIGGTSAGAAVQANVMIAGGNEEPILGTGFDLWPNATIDQHFTSRNRLPRLLQTIQRHPQLTGWGIDEETALVRDPQGVRVLGRGTVTMVRQTTGGGQPQIQVWRAGDVVRLPEDGTPTQRRCPSVQQLQPLFDRNFRSCRPN